MKISLKCVELVQDLCQSIFLNAYYLACSTEVLVLSDIGVTSMHALAE